MLFFLSFLLGFCGFCSIVCTDEFLKCLFPWPQDGSVMNTEGTVKHCRWNNACLLLL